MSTGMESIVIHEFKKDLDLSRSLFTIIHPFIRGRTLEIGSGKSLQSTIFIENNLPLHLSDSDRANCERLYELFHNIPIIRAVHKIDLHHPDFEQYYSKFIGAFNTIISLNIGENMLIDPAVIRNVKLLLAERGRLIVLASTHIVLYHGLDPDWVDLKQHADKFFTKQLGNDFDILKTQYITIRERAEYVDQGPVFLSAIIAGRKK